MQYVHVPLPVYVQMQEALFEKIKGKDISPQEEKLRRENTSLKEQVSKLTLSSICDTVEDKVTRDVFMELADRLKTAQQEENLEEIGKIERVLRKYAFGRLD